MSPLLQKLSHQLCMLTDMRILQERYRYKIKRLYLDAKSRHTRGLRSIDWRCETWKNYAWISNFSVQKFKFTFLSKFSMNFKKRFYYILQRPSKRDSKKRGESDGFSICWFAPNPANSLGWVRLKEGAWNSTWVFLPGGRDPRI